LEIRPGEKEANAVVQMAHLLEFQYGTMIRMLEDMRNRGVDVEGPLERAGLKICNRTRPEVLERLAAAEDQMAEEHETEAAMHRHRAQELRGRTRNGQISGPAEASGGVGE